MNLVDRTKSILLSPQQGWQAIDEEETSIGGLVTGYIVPLAAIGPVASLIGMEIFGISVPQHKVMGYTVVVIMCAVVLFFLIGVIAAQLGGGPVIEAS